MINNMKRLLSWFVLIVSIAVLVSSCESYKDSSASSIDNSSSLSVSGIFVAVGYSGNIVRSTDNGSSWDNATSPTANTLYGVVFGNNTFVGVGASGNIVRSTDNGSSFDNATSPTSNSIKGVTFNE